MVGRASRDSTGFGALEEGLISSWGRNLRVPLVSEKQMHSQVGRYAAEHGVDCLICAGPLAADIYEGAKETGLCETHYFADRDLMMAQIKELLKTGDSVLIKASNGMGFAKVVELLEQEK